MRSVLLASLLLLCIQPSVGQDRFSAKALGGILIPHRPVMKGLVTGHTGGVELAYEKRVDGSKAWHQSYGRPTTGISLVCLNSGNTRVVGYAFGLTPYLRIPFVASNDVFALKLGFGAGYLSRPFDRLRNHKNIAIGSALNASIFVALSHRSKISKKLFLTSSFQFQHYSNGAFASPNLGINVPLLGLGLEWATPSLIHTEVSEKGSIDQPVSYFLSTRFGMKELLPTGSEKYPIYTIHLSRLKTFSAKFGWTIFADLMYNSALIQEFREIPVPTEAAYKYAQLGVGAGLENTYGDFSIYVQLGAYLHSRLPEPKNFYHRLGIKHTIAKKYYLSFGLKSHFTTADYLELGCGFQLR